MRNACINCDHSDKERTNDKGQIRCKKNHTYTEKSGFCEYHTNKELEELLSILFEEEWKQ